MSFGQGLHHLSFGKGYKIRFENHSLTKPWSLLNLGAVNLKSIPYQPWKLNKREIKAEKTCELLSLIVRPVKMVGQPRR